MRSFLTLCAPYFVSVNVGYNSAYMVRWPTPVHMAVVLVIY